MSRDPENIFAEGVVVAIEENGTRQVRMPNGHELTAFLPGKMKAKRIPLLLGEKVMLEISPYDLSRGRVVADNFVGSEAPESFEFVDAEADEDQSPSLTRASFEVTKPVESTVASREAIPSGGFVVP